MTVRNGMLSEGQGMEIRERTGEVWGFLDTEYLNAAENIALDETLLELRSAGKIVNTFRLLQFQPRCILVGYHQCVESEVRLNYCFEREIQVNRRITGGGAIFFQPEHIGWEIIAGKPSLNMKTNTEEMSRFLSRGLVDALRSLGIDAEFRPRNDVEVEGRKISGMGGTEMENAFLFQGTLLTTCDLQAMLHALRIPIKKLSDKEIESVHDRITTMEWELGQLPDLSRVKKALIDAFSKALCANFVQRDLSDLELSLLSEKLPRFHSPEWIFRERRPLDKVNEMHASRKTPGGIVHIALTIDRGLIENILITGDFFAYPRRAITDLEASLKFTPARAESIREIVAAFLKDNDVQLPGIDVDALMKVFSETLEKTTYTDLGLDRGEVNDIYIVNTSLRGALEKGFDTILVPYCCKSLSCGFRNHVECGICGGCDASPLYELGSQQGLRVLTIIDYEHLKEVLSKLDEWGSKGYLGACCEAWYEKHHLDLEMFKTSGVLVEIDSNSCYDLGMEKIAHQGKYENQTNLDLDVMVKILCISQSMGKAVKQEIHQTN